MKVFTAQQMRDFDKSASQEFALPSIVLMENAALRVVEFLEMKFAPLCDKHIVVLCGKGNNGGDGFAIARHLSNARCCVTVLMACSPNGLKGDALANYETLRHLAAGETRRPDLIEVTATGALERLFETDNPVHGAHLGQYFHADGSDIGLSVWPDIIFDCLLGTGFKGEIQDERLKAALSFWFWPNQRAVKVSVDLPSGLNADSGEAATVENPEYDGYMDSKDLNAHYTITFAAPKRGMFLRDGIEKCGEVWIGDIGAAPDSVQEIDTGAQCITRFFARCLAPHRPVDAHKGTAGRVVICGGSLGMSGALTLASRASLRVGAGLCTACLPEKVLPTFAAGFLEATSHALPCDDEGRLIPSAADAVHEYSSGADVLALGPGLSRSEGALDFARRVVTESKLPLILDADALYSLRAIEDKVKARIFPTILTPHPGEMGELLDMSTQAVQEDRITAATSCAAKYHAIVVLKGARSIVALPDGQIFFNLTGNAGMATGGSGDVLTGTIAGLLAQTKDAQTATLLGVYLHGSAGDIAYRTKGNGLIAGDIADALPQAILELDEEVDAPINTRLRRLA